MSAPARWRLRWTSVRRRPLRVLAAVLALALPGSAASPPAPPPVALFLGSSTVAGTGASQPTRRWTSLVSARLGWVEHNAGLAGSTVTDRTALAPPRLTPAANERLGALDVRPAPDVVVIQYGANDMLAAAPLGSAHEPSTFRGSLARMLTGLRARYPAAVLVVVSPQPAPALEATRAPYDRSLQEAAAMAGAVFVDVGGAIAPPQRVPFAPDGLHLDDRGHEALARWIAAELHARGVPAAAPAGGGRDQARAR